MTEAASPPPKPLEIRGRPRPVKRFSKRALMILFGTGSAIVLGSLAFALQGPKEDAGGPARELYNTGHNPEADGLSELPKSYGELPREDILGPPLPGDLGTPILKAQREGRMGLSEEDAPEADPMREHLAALEAEPGRVIVAGQNSRVLSGGWGPAGVHGRKKSFVRARANGELLLYKGA